MQRFPHASGPVLGDLLPANAHITTVPFGASAADGQCDQTGSATPRRSHGPDGSLAVKCATKEFVCHVVTPQFPANSAAYM